MQQSMVGGGSHKELDRTERLTELFHFFLPPPHPAPLCYHMSALWQPTPVILPGEFHEQRSLAGYSPWGCKESGMTEQLSLTTVTHSGSRHAGSPEFTVMG